MGTVYRNGSYPGDYKFSGNGTVSAGYFACDASVLSQAAYPSLFAAIGTQFNTGGEGAGNFRIPDHRGRSPMGAGTGVGLSARSIGQQVGEEGHQLSTGELASHSHGVNDPTHVHGPGSPGTNFLEGGVGGGSVTPGSAGSLGTTTAPSSTGISIQNTGSGTAHNTIHPSLVCNILIKY